MKKKDKTVTTFEGNLVPPELIKEEIKILRKMFQSLPYAIKGNENSIKKLKKNFKVTRKKVSSLWGIPIYIDPSLPDYMIKLVGKKKTNIINIKEE